MCSQVILRTVTYCSFNYLLFSHQSLYGFCYLNCTMPIKRENCLQVFTLSAPSQSKSNFVSTIGHVCCSALLVYSKLKGQIIYEKKRFQFLVKKHISTYCIFNAVKKTYIVFFIFIKKKGFIFIKTVLKNQANSSLQDMILEWRYIYQLYT